MDGVLRLKTRGNNEDEVDAP
ncbi:uncharacterized protein G2W53_034275 [Senna tora]|uniref:Uncharacterized protein n=1 Tax=Senna tora TaxID=362788 RepID=A0A834TAS1_9FABA|nr:uncharacterized protein G2W53_034275 [Senna tora]